MEAPSLPPVLLCFFLFLSNHLPTHPPSSQTINSKQSSPSALLDTSRHPGGDWPGLSCHSHHQSPLNPRLQALGAWGRACHFHSRQAGQVGGFQF